MSLLRLGLKTLTTMTTTTKTVAIIGAGPAGLVTAKTLIHNLPSSSQIKFHVTIFDKLPRIGGLWPSSTCKDEGGEGMMSPDMCTNQSKHTVSFSDLAWGEDVASFPRAWEVGDYLERYRGVYGGFGVELGKEVVGTERRGEGWSVVVRDVKEGKEESKEFDYLVVATGFFGKPILPPILENVSSKVPVRHSSKVRDVEELVVDGEKRDFKVAKERNIVVVGGQMSGVETAANIAFQLSSLENSPGNEDESKKWEGWTVTHVIEKPVWILPLFFPRDPVVDVSAEGEKIKKPNPAPEFLPLDLVNYNIGWRPPGPIQNTSGHITEEGANMVHGFMETYIGTDQTEYGAPILSMKGDAVRDEPPMLACSDYYAEFVRAGRIKVVQGRMKSVSEDGLGMEVENSSATNTQISSIAAIIPATGFSASPSISFLPSSLLQSLNFSPTSTFFPLSLSVHSTISTLISSLGFVGFYRSPYWGIIEMQARYLAHLWSGGTKAAQALEEDESAEAMLKLRGDPRRAQFPMGDYTYLMESFASILDIKRSGPEEREGIILPSRYLPSPAPSSQLAESTKALSIINTVFSSPQKYLPRATFRALQGTWSLSRTISSALPTFPSGTLTGIANFLPRNPTGGDAEMEYLYLEEGEFRPSWGGTMTARRGYVWGLNEAKGEVDVWFVKGDGKSRDYFFHRVGFEKKDGKKGEEGWRARSSHLCIEDLYNVEYEFFFRGTVIDRWTSRYNVKGPKKDYTIENVYTRPFLRI